MKINLEKLYQKAAERPAGYLEEVIAAGTVKDGWLYLDSAAARTLRQKYSPTPSTSLRGLGDLVAKVAKPIARAIDRVAGTKLEHCQPCARRQAKLNAAVPFKNSGQ